MLAYVFWHTRDRNGDSAAYERALASFHQALAEEPPPGFLGCAAHRVENCAWQPAPAYADWYLVADWQALGTLNSAAVDARRRAHHDGAAARAVAGAGGVYLLRAGGHCIDVPAVELWLDKPAAVPRDEFRAQLERAAGDGGGIWERQMVLGPAPEFCAVTDAGVASAPVAGSVVQRHAVYSRLAAA